MRRPRFVTRPYICTVAALVVAAARISAAEFSPYEARVVATGASVHSGPGDNFYPTDTLAQGDVVEVYKEKSGGWLAIRPPVNSFSWVSAGDLEMRDGGIAEVINDGVASRIGSRLSDKHNAAQVKLKKGEFVEVMDEETIGDEKWCKISPPDGEFRWIRATLVERVGVIQMASAESATPAGTTSSEPKADAVAPPLMPNTSAANAPATPSGAAATTPAATTSPLPTAATTAAAPAAAPVAPVAKSPAAGPVADDLSRELAAIELRLSRMVAAPVNLWNTERLERDAAQLLSRAHTTAERDAVQTTLNKIRQFSAIGLRAGQMPTTAAAANGATSNPAAIAANVAPGAAAATIPGAPAADGNGQFDAVGILRPVVSRRPGAPQFALVDDRGQVLSFVTPSPDVNLQPYLGRRVGVTGNRGFITEFNRSHVTAARVAPLSDRMLR